MRIIISIGCIAALILLSVSCKGNGEIPAVFDKENTAYGYKAPSMPDLDKLPVIEGLPDPLTFADGRPVTRYSQWEKRRSEILAMIEHYEVGLKPQTPKECVNAWMQQDTMVVEVIVNGEALSMHCLVSVPDGEGPFPAIIGMGSPSGSLPANIFKTRNIATVTFPFTEVMSHTQRRGEEPINRLYPDLVENGAYVMWPWGVSRLIDGLEILQDELNIDIKHLGVTGCSFAGKMALFSGAFDERIALTIAQEPGGGGAAAWRISETLGYVETIERTNYSWFKESMKQFQLENAVKLPVDHNELCALVAPRALLVLGNPDYEWMADKSGYLSCKDARRVWEAFGIADRMGYSFQDKHMHCMLPKEQYPDIEAFIDRFMLGKDVPTDIQKAPMFE